MGNLHSKFSIVYSNFASGKIAPNGTICNEKYFLSNWITQNNMPISKLRQIFDDFYGGSIKKCNEDLILKDIPIRELWVDTGRVRIILGIGHVQENVWICDFKDGFFTEEELVKEYIEKYLKNVMSEFPHAMNKFIHVFESNPYEICDMLNLKDVTPFDISQIFKEAFEIMIKKNN